MFDKFDNNYLFKDKYFNFNINNKFLLDMVWILFKCCLDISCGLNWDPQTLSNENSFCIYPVTNRVLSCGQHGIASCNTTWFPAEPAH